MVGPIDSSAWIFNELYKTIVIELRKLNGSICFLIDTYLC
jgi:hypothetical protein